MITAELTDTNCVALYPTHFEGTHWGITTTCREADFHEVSKDLNLGPPHQPTWSFRKAQNQQETIHNEVWIAAEWLDSPMFSWKLWTKGSSKHKQAPAFRKYRRDHACINLVIRTLDWIDGRTGHRTQLWPAAALPKGPKLYVASTNSPLVTQRSLNKYLLLLSNPTNPCRYWTDMTQKGH